MSQKSLTQKLLIKPGHNVLLLNVPQEYADMLLPLPDGATVSTTPGEPSDCVLAFTYNRADVETYTPTVTEAVKPDGLLWFAYPKKTSKIKTDITRDVGWDTLYGTGWQGVAMIAIDDMWAAMRYRPNEKVKRQK